MHHETMDVDFWVFEPKDEYKGDFARTYFYVITCYGRDLYGQYPDLPPTSKKSGYGWRLDNASVGSQYAMQNDNYLEFQPWEQELLIQWHRKDPVSEKEIKRADAVSNFQHNRNPFIDYPYFAEYIWGEKAGQKVDMTHLISSSDSRFELGKSNGWIEITEDIENQQILTPRSKFIRSGQLLIRVGDQIYTVTGQRVQ